MNAWVITWECASERQGSKIKNHIASILPEHTNEEVVKCVMHLLYANHCACGPHSEHIHSAEQVRFAAGEFPYRPTQDGRGGFTCGHNPYLRARRVQDLTVTRDPDDHDVLTWVEVRIPIPPHGVEDPGKYIDDRRPFPRRLVTFRAMTDTLTTGEWEQSGTTPTQE
jgi:hypothetical protein